jgi:hypothetical protein
MLPCPPAGFHLKPFGFFDYNPGRDLPPGPNKGERQRQALPLFV